MNFMLGITPWPVVSALLWIVLITGALYLIRGTAHRTIQAAASGLHHSFRVASRAVTHSEKHLAARNRDVLLAYPLNRRIGPEGNLLKRKPWIFDTFGNQLVTNSARVSGLRAGSAAAPEKPPAPPAAGLSL